MPEMFITFEGISSGPCRGFYRKQSLANAAATDNTDIVAHVGSLEVGNLVPSDSYFNGTAVVSDEALETVNYLALPEVDKLKLAFRAFHDALIQGSEFLETPSIRRYYPEEDHRIAHTMLALAHRACRAIGLSSAWTSTQKFAWLTSMASGPTDVSFADGPETAAERFFSVVETARMTDSPITTPDEYFMWADPDDASRRSLSDCPELVTSNDEDFAAATTDFSVFLHGGWISDITI